ncbi:MAG: hypothetical protein ABL959_21320, partial [Pyrinomonadaceae bacterium]
VRLGFSPATANVKTARLRIEQPSRKSGDREFSPKAATKIERGASVITLGTTTTHIDLVETK